MSRRAGDSPSASASLVPLSAGAGGTPVYLVHGVTPRPWMFRSLVPALGIDRPIYGTSSPEIEWEREVLTIEELGAYYATEIKRLQPHGPYSLVGYSLGGIVAFAIAERLRRDGERISHLVLLDTTPPPRFPWAPGWSFFAIAALLRWLSHYGLLTHAFVHRVPLKTCAGTLTRPIGRVRLAFGSGPLTARELRAALQVAFPGYPRRRTNAMSFEALSAAIAAELKRALSEEEWTKVVRMAGSEAPSTVIKSAKLSAKN
jgi:pimeloyl-ACP methyl ester carboxylesterase